MSSECVPVKKLTVEQLGFLLAALDLDQYIDEFKAQKIDGGIIAVCTSREEMKDEGVDMTKGRFAKLRDRVEEYTDGGVPCDVLDQGRTSLAEVIVIIIFIMIE
jgi:hypothetical protein